LLILHFSFDRPRRPRPGPRHCHRSPHGFVPGSEGIVGIATTTICCGVLVKTPQDKFGSCHPCVSFMESKGQ
jgi:hypothetical protein